MHRDTLQWVRLFLVGGGYDLDDASDEDDRDIHNDENSDGDDDSYNGNDVWTTIKLLQMYV